jgi:hypothetical protein
MSYINKQTKNKAEVSDRSRLKRDEREDWLFYFGWLVTYKVVRWLQQRFSTAGPRAGTGPHSRKGSELLGDIVLAG